MVDKLRKFGELLWLNKERFILVVMVGILCFQVYKVLYPEQKAAAAPPREPQAAPGEAEPPPSPPDSPLATAFGDYPSLYRRNPFWYMSGRNQKNSGQSSEEINIKLLNIRNVSGRIRAQIQTATTTQWYDVGAGFEQFRLESVDESGGTATVYVESLGKDITLTVQQ